MSVLLSVLPSPIFSIAVFSATVHHSHFKLTMVLWLGVLLCHLQYSGLPVIYFLFYNLVYFPTFGPYPIFSVVSQPPKTWYSALARGLTCCLPNSDPAVIYFLFYDLLYFPTFGP